MQSRIAKADFCKCNKYVCYIVREISYSLTYLLVLYGLKGSTHNDNLKVVLI